MKKIISILLMLTLLLGTAAAALGIETGHLQKLQQDPGAAKSRDNPAPPDPGYLDMLGLEPFVSHMPVIMLDTQGQQILREEKKPVTVAIYDRADGENDILGRPTEVLDGTLKLRGASSHNFDKPQFRLTFLNRKGTKPLAFNLGGLGADSDWILNGPYLDRTLLRNYLMYKLSGEIMDWAPDCRFCEVFVDGRYLGVYLILEPVTEGASRLRISELGLLSGATGYIGARERIGTSGCPISTPGLERGFTVNEVGIRFPRREDMTQAQLDWISQDLRAFEEALYGEHFADPGLGYGGHIDIQSFVDYFILNELALNHDGGNLSTYFYQKLEGKLKLCVWDFNNGFDNYQWFYMPTDQFILIENNWFERLCQDRAFVDRILARYQQLRQGPLSDEHIRAILDQGHAELGEALDRNTVRWGYSYSAGYLYQSPGRPRPDRSYQEAMDRMETVIRRRLDFMDHHMEDLYSVCIN